MQRWHGCATLPIVVMGTIKRQTKIAPLGVAIVQVRPTRHVSLPVERELMETVTETVQPLCAQIRIESFARTRRGLVAARVPEARLPMASRIAAMRELRPLQEEQLRGTRRQVEVRQPRGNEILRRS